MKENLINELAELTMNEKMIKRCLDVKCFDDESRRKCFVELQEIKRRIEKVKFKLRVEKEMKNEECRKKVWG